MKFAEAATVLLPTDEIAGKFTIDSNNSNTYSVQNIDNSLYVVGVASCMSMQSVAVQTAVTRLSMTMFVDSPDL